MVPALTTSAPARVLVLAASCLFGSASLGQSCGGWTRVALTGINPGPLAYASMAYDSVRGRTVLYGGEQGNFSNGTWEWNGTTWTHSAAWDPGWRVGAAMAFDSARGRCVLFGGQGSNSDTWTWDGATWTLAATVGPPGRARTAMAFDSSRGRAVLFGGTNFGDTWEWNGSAWSQVSNTGPAAREAFGMAYDGQRHRTVVFGGYDTTSGTPFGDTWEWDGAGWSQRAQAGPTPRFQGSMAYDTGRGRCVFFGGLIACGVTCGDTWEWDGTVWAYRQSDVPAGRYAESLAFDSGRGRIVLYGAQSGFLSETWELGVPIAPLISQQPAGLTVSGGQPATLTIAATGTGPLTLQWRRNAVALSNGGNISGAITPTLTIDPTSPADAGAYDCIVSNGCATARSDPAALTVQACYPNCDGSTTAPVLNALDFACFLNRFAAGCS